jgi:type IV secretion system protein VirB8
MSNTNEDKTVKQSIISESINFETNLTYRIKRSERLAWTVAIFSVVMSVLLSVGYILIMPLKERVPYLLLANTYNGTSSLSKIIGASNIEEINSNEALAKSNIAKFLTARESYDFDLIGRPDWLIVHSMAGVDGSRSVLESYKKLYENSNPNSLAKLYGKTSSIRVKIKSIILTVDADPKKGYTLATVRFNKLIINKETDKIEDISSNNATISFSYNIDLQMPEEMRLQNPLGFIVTGYRVDPDINYSTKDLLKEYTN